uniref:Uncharacterized protein n=1 Tax=Arundo donax TaxID=35708 RepID=A0A0A8XR16_ARUDO
MPNNKQKQRSEKLHSYPLDMEGRWMGRSQRNARSIVMGRGGVAVYLLAYKNDKAGTNGTYRWPNI